VPLITSEVIPDIQNRSVRFCVMKDAICNVSIHRKRPGTITSGHEAHNVSEICAGRICGKLTSGFLVSFSCPGCLRCQLFWSNVPPAVGLLIQRDFQIPRTSQIARSGRRRRCWTARGWHLTMGSVRSCSVLNDPKYKARASASISFLRCTRSKSSFFCDQHHETRGNLGCSCGRAKPCLSSPLC
jgi:hypothetical protein